MNELPPEQQEVVLKVKRFLDNRWFNFVAGVVIMATSVYLTLKGLEALQLPLW